jgi:hypothetical protein
MPGDGHDVGHSEGRPRPPQTGRAPSRRVGGPASSGMASARADPSDSSDASASQPCGEHRRQPAGRREHPVRRLPVGPPSSVFFQARAAILDNDDPVIVGLLANGQLRSITGHGELDNARGCFLRITPTRGINTYGLGMSLRRLLRDPLNAGGSIELPV